MLAFLLIFEGEQWLVNVHICLNQKRGDIYHSMAMKSNVEKVAAVISTILMQF